MARDHAYIRVWEETWESLKGPREAYDRETRDWQEVPVTTWGMVAKNLWGDAAPATEIEFEDDEFMAQVRVRSPLIYPTEIDISMEISTVAGETDWTKAWLNLMPWYERDSEVIKNCAKMAGAVLSTIESYILVVKDSMNLSTAITTLPDFEAEIGVLTGNLSLSERRDNVRRIWRMMNENVAWAPNQVYYLPFIGEYSASNAQVEGTTIHDPDHYDDPVVQAKVASWANLNGLEVVP